MSQLTSKKEITFKEVTKHMINILSNGQNIAELSVSEHKSSIYFKTPPTLQELNNIIQKLLEEYPHLTDVETFVTNRI